MNQEFGHREVTAKGLARHGGAPNHALIMTCARKTDGRGARTVTSGVMSNRILIVDRDAEGSDSNGRIAAACGYTVATATSAGQFLQYLHLWRPTDILLDLHMQETDGSAMLRHLWEAKSDARIVIVGRAAEQAMLEIARRLGMAHGLTIAGVMFKPIHPGELRAMLEGLREDAQWLTEAAVESAIANDELFLEYQPKIALRSGLVEGVEALVRWRHPRRGLVSPGEFIPFVERTELMGRLTGRVLNGALRQLKAWMAMGIELDMAINLSARDLRDPRFADTVSQACLELGIPPGMVTFELTESAVIDDPANAVAVLGRLRDNGVRLAIDDFGTGYSALGQLRRLPFSQIKIDRSLVGECHRSRDSAAIIVMIVGLARSLGLTSVAEGVENEAELKTVTRLGCDCAQGHVIAPPLPACEFAAWLNDRQKVPDAGSSAKRLTAPGMLPAPHSV